MAGTILSQGVYQHVGSCVATAGTASALAPTGGPRYAQITIVAKHNNAGRVYQGGPTITATMVSGLAAGNSIIVGSGRPGGNSMVDASTIFIDVDASGEGVDWYGDVV